MKILMLWLFSQFVCAYEYTDAFVVSIYDQRMKVTSPKKNDKDLNVIIKNETQVKFLAKLQGKSGKNYLYFSIDPKKSQSKKLVGFDQEKIYLIPLAPSLQKVHLKLGSKPYEIPPKE